MSTVTNNFSEQLLKEIREWEKNPEQDNKKLAGTLAQIKYLQECLEEKEKRIKKQLKEQGYNELNYYPEIQKKVYLSEGRSTSEYDIMSISKSIDADVFCNIISIVQKKVDEQEKEVQDIVESFKKSEKGEPFITVYKMNKQELIEHTS